MTLDANSAAALLAQLGNPTRLEVVRLLVRAGHAGAAVGEIQRVLGIPASTLSHHLGHLRRVGLVAQEREGTVLRCRADYERLEGLIAFLTDQCCSGLDVVARGKGRAAGAGSGSRAGRQAR